MEHVNNRDKTKTFIYQIMGTDKFHRREKKIVTISENEIGNTKNRYLNCQFVIVFFLSCASENDSLKFIFRIIDKHLIFSPILCVCTPRLIIFHSINKDYHDTPTKQVGCVILLFMSIEKWSKINDNKSCAD